MNRVSKLVMLMVLASFAACVEPPGDDLPATETEAATVSAIAVSDQSHELNVPPVRALTLRAAVVCESYCGNGFDFCKSICGCIMSVCTATQYGVNYCACGDLP